jgi:hypothetical protein
MNVAAAQVRRLQYTFLDASPFTPRYSPVAAKYRNFNGLAWSKAIFWDNLGAGKSV